MFVRACRHHSAIGRSFDELIRTRYARQYRDDGGVADAGYHRFAGGGLDFYRWSNQRAAMKGVSDLLATRGARELLLPNANETRIISVLKTAVKSGVGEPPSKRQRMALWSASCFFEDRNAPFGRTHRIMSDDARNLLGTFYLSRGSLRVSSMLPIADESAHTIIVARELALTGSQTLVLNTDYAASTVPSPAGLGPIGGTTFMRE